MKGIYKRYVPGVTAPGEHNEKDICFVFHRSKMLVKLDGERISFPSKAELKDIGVKPLREQYLGTLEGADCYSVEATGDAIERDGFVYRELRSLMGVLEDDLFLLAGRALQIVNWDQTHQYCGRCGAPTQTLEGERAKVCPECGLTSYPRISPAIIVAVTRGDKILLAHANHFAEEMYSVVAGFLEPGETFEECVEREVMEETSIRVRDITYFGSQPWPFPNSMMVAFTAQYAGGEIQVDGKEIGKAGWFTADNLPQIPGRGSVSRQLIDHFVECSSKKTGAR